MKIFKCMTLLCVFLSLCFAGCSGDGPAAAPVNSEKDMQKSMEDMGKMAPKSFEKGASESGGGAPAGK
jgi:hypothetical protein